MTEIGDGYVLIDDSITSLASSEIRTALRPFKVSYMSTIKVYLTSQYPSFFEPILVMNSSALKSAQENLITDRLIY